MSSEFLPQIRQLYLISGTPRSGTTFLHDQVVGQGFLPGLVRERDGTWRRDFQTNEYRPSMEAAVHYAFTTSQTKRNNQILELVDSLQGLSEKFLSNDGKMLLKAPHYCYCGEAYKNLLGDRVKVLFLRRDYLDCGLSMSKHQVIGPQLEASPSLTGDFQTGKWLFRRGVDTKWAHPAVTKFAEENWASLSKLERAFYKIHYFRRASNVSGTFLTTQHAILDYPNMASSEGIQKISRFLDTTDEIVNQLLADFKPVPSITNMSDISDIGQKFLMLCKDYEAVL